MSSRKSICFVSEKNVCRSIIAELLLRKLGKQQLDVHSFGLRADRVHYLVSEAMKARGIDPSYSFSKVYAVISNQKFDHVVVLDPDLADKLPADLDSGVTKEVWEIEPVDFQQDDESAIKEQIEKVIAQLEDKVQQLAQKYL